MTIVLTGASDDLIEVDGDIRDEFTYQDVDVNVVAFSDGTVLRIKYDDDGIWRITPVARGTAGLKIEQSTGPDDVVYTDRATLDGDIAWVVHGSAIAQKAPKKPMVHR